MLSHRTPTKPGELRKNEPNPMGLLAPIGKLVNHLTEDLVLRIQKSNEVRIGHPRSVVQAMAVFECDRPTIPFMESRRRIWLSKGRDFAFAKRNEITLENQIDNPLSPKSRRERVFSFDYFLGELMAPCRIDSGIPNNGDAQGEYEGRCCADWYDCEMER